MNDSGGWLRLSLKQSAGLMAAIASGVSSGGGISNVNSGNGFFGGGVAIMNSAIANNESDAFGGGISNFSSTLNMANTPSTATGPIAAAAASATPGRCR